MREVMGKEAVWKDIEGKLLTIENNFNAKIESQYANLPKKFTDFNKDSEQLINQKLETLSYAIETVKKRQRDLSNDFDQLGKKASSGGIDEASLKLLKDQNSKIEKLGKCVKELQPNVQGLQDQLKAFKSLEIGPGEMKNNGEIGFGVEVVTKMASKIDNLRSDLEINFRQVKELETFNKLLLRLEGDVSQLKIEKLRLDNAKFEMEEYKMDDHFTEKTELEIGENNPQNESKLIKNYSRVKKLTFQLEKWCLQ